MATEARGNVRGPQSVAVLGHGKIPWLSSEPPLCSGRMAVDMRKSKIQDPRYWYICFSVFTAVFSIQRALSKYMLNRCLKNAQLGRAWGGLFTSRAMILQPKRADTSCSCCNKCYHGTWQLNIQKKSFVVTMTQLLSVNFQSSNLLFCKLR